ncbi:hypothetical protein [Clostridium sp. BJN0013]|uniref:hypothetical protein n=1 Tax=Clostridium sp. BJN0013 TaxID=3236840 RepID=UPI0034C5EF89
MVNKKFLYGFAAGLVSYRFYHNVKNNIRPMAMKMIRNTLAIRENARSFIDEIKIEVQRQNNDICNTVSEIDRQKDFKFLEEQRHALDKMSELKKQLESISDKVDNF